MEESFERKITEGKNFLLVRLSTNKYKLVSSVENPNIYMHNILNFNLINLMYRTNLDKFESVKLEIVNKNEANIFLLVKHLLKDFGLKQRYVSFYITRYDYEGGTKFSLKQDPIYGEQTNKCSNASLLPITDIFYDFKLENAHKLLITQYIYFDNDTTIPAFLEPFFGIIMKTMHKKTLQYIRELKL